MPINQQKKSLNTLPKKDCQCVNDDSAFIQLTEKQFDEFVKALHEPPSKEVRAGRERLKRYELWK